MAHGTRVACLGMWMALTAGCSGATSGDPNAGGAAGPPTASVTAVPTQAPVATASAAASATAAPTASATGEAAPAAPKVVYDVDAADGVRRMAKWDGPVEGEVIKAKKAWVVAPNVQVEGSTRLSFEQQALRLVDVVKADKNEVVFEINKNQYAVPAALARAGTTKGLKKGMAARCSQSGSGEVGLLTAVDAKSAVCAIRFLERTESLKLTPEEVLPLSADKPSLGTPVIARSANARGSLHGGWVVAAKGDDLWISFERGFSDYPSRVNGAIFKVSAANVTAIDASKPLKVGDACLARQIQLVNPCKVTKVHDGGVGYTVSFDDGQSAVDKEWSAGSVAPAPKEKTP